jgi:hypothetical protein
MMDMLKNGLKCIRKRTLCGLLLPLVLASWAWVDIGEAQPLGAAPAMQAGTGSKAGAPRARTTSKSVAKRTIAKPTEGGPPIPMAGRVPEIVGRRDPFKLPSPPVPGQAGPEEVTGPLPTGKRGVLVSRLRLEGIVRLDTTNTLIAVVDTSANRAYFLRENDQLYDGVVSKITPDSVSFRQNVLDPNGRVTVREVVRRLGQGPGA